MAAAMRTTIRSDLQLFRARTELCMRAVSTAIESSTSSSRGTGSSNPIGDNPSSPVFQDDLSGQIPPLSNGIDRFRLQTLRRVRPRGAVLAVPATIHERVYRIQFYPGAGLGKEACLSSTPAE